MNFELIYNKIKIIFNKVNFIEERYRVFWSLILFLTALLLMRLSRADVLVQFFVSFSMASIFIFINYKKMFKESVVNKCNRDVNFEIAFLLLSICGATLIIKTNIYREVFYNFNFKFLWMFIFTALLLSIKSKIDRANFTVNDDLQDKIHMGSIVGKFFHRPYFIKEKDRIYHQITYGVTGSGKTVGALYPQIKHDIRTGKFTVILEPKGDNAFRDYVYSCCKRYNRKFKFISIGSSEISSGYNPFGFGDANAVKDKIMSSTDWSEQFYKKIADTALLKALRAIEGEVSNNNQSRNKFNGFCLDNIIGLLPDIENLSGLRAFLESLKYSSFASMFNADSPTLYDYFTDNVVLFVSLDSLAYPEVSTSLGRIILQDLSTLIGHIIATIPEKQRPPNSLYVDEMATFYSDNFLPFLSQTRSGNIRVHMACQSPADFSIHDQGVLARINDNTSTKIIMASCDPDSREYLARLVGTKEIIKTTKQVDGNNKSETGRGSSRDAHQFILDPDNIKSYQAGESFIYARTSLSYEEVDLDTVFFDDTIIESYGDAVSRAQQNKDQVAIVPTIAAVSINKINEGERKNERAWH
jgi:type IV secretory pathway TraG/TraD family ATPase VirD4